MSAPVQETAFVPRGRGRGRGSGGGGGGRPHSQHRNHGDHETSASGGTRFSELGNPLPPLAANEIQPKSEAPHVVNTPVTERKSETVPKLSSGPPSVMRTSSQSSNISTPSSVGGGGNRGGRTDRPSHQRGGGGNGNERRQHNTNTPRSNGNSAPVFSAPSSANMPKWPQVPTPKTEKLPSEGGSGVPETLSAANWGDDEEESVTSDVVETRLRTQLERARNEKVAIQKQLSDLQANLEQVKIDATKHKSEADSIRTQLEKAAIMEKSYATLRQTRDLLETERDTLKKNLMKVEKDLKLAKEDNDKELTKLKFEIEALNAQITYQKIELEESQLGSSSSVPAQGHWLFACDASVSIEGVGDALGFNSFESARVNIALWEAASEAGFHQSISNLAFERGGEKLNVASSTFLLDASQAFSRIFKAHEMLLFLPRHQDGPLPRARYEELTQQFLKMIHDARESGGKRFALVLESYPFNRMQVSERRFAPVHFVAL